MASIITISPEYKITSALLDAIKLREDNQVDTLYMQVPMDKELDDISFLTAVSQGYPEFFQMGNLYINRERIQSIRELNNVYYILTTYGYLFEVGMIPYTIEEMLAFSGSSGSGGGGGGGPSLGEWDMSITSSGTVNLPGASKNGQVVNGSNGNFTTTWTGVDSPAPSFVTTAASLSSPSISMNFTSSDSSSKMVLAMIANQEVDNNGIWDAILFNTWPVNFTGAFYCITGYNTNDFAAVIFTDNLGNGPSQQVTGTLPRIPTPGVDKIDVYFVENGFNYDFYVGIAGDNDYQLVISLPVANAPTGLRAHSIAIWTAGPPVPNFTVSANFGFSAGEAIKPSDAVFGSTYLVTGDGTYAGNACLTGWIVEFVGDTDLFVYRPFDSVQSAIDDSIAAALVGVPDGTSTLSYASASYDTVTLYNYAIATDGVDPTAFNGAQYKKLFINEVGNVASNGANITVYLGNVFPITKDILIELELDDTGPDNMDYYYSSTNSGGVNTTLNNLSITFMCDDVVLGFYMFPITRLKGQLWRVSGSSVELVASRLKSYSNTLDWYQDKHSIEGVYSMIIDTTNPTIQNPYYNLDKIYIIPDIDDFTLSLGNDDGTSHLNMRRKTYKIDNSSARRFTLAVPGSANMIMPVGILNLEITPDSSIAGSGTAVKVLNAPTAELLLKPVPIGFTGNYSLDLAPLQQFFQRNDFVISLDGIADGAGINISTVQGSSVDLSLLGGVGIYNLFTNTSNFVKVYALCNATIINNAMVTFNKFGQSHDVVTIYVQDTDTTISIPFINAQRIKLDTSALTGPISIGLSGLIKMIDAYGNVVINATGSAHPVTVLGITLQENEAIECTYNKVQALGVWSPPVIG